MATLHILNRLRRSVPKVSRQFHFLSNRNPNPNSTAALSSLLRHFPRLDCPGMASANVAPLAGARGSFGARSIFTRSDYDSVFSDSGGFDFGSVAELAAESKVLDSGPAGGEESILPVRAVISMLDGFHDLTGLPWWIVIACSTLVLRATLFPLFIVQLHKLKKIGELYHKLPPSLPPLFSGKSYVDHISLFREKRKAIGCPSYLWYLAYFSVQVPCFLLLLTTIRRMSLDHHPGFDCGGALWFLNLTEFSHGALGSIFPVAVAGLHYANVQISFQTLSASKGSGIFNIKYFKIFMDLLTLPILLTCYYVPQGSLVYWVTNSSLTFIQKLSLKNPSVRVTLGLPSSDDSSAVGSSSIDTSTVTPSSKSENHKISVEDLTPKELTSLSVQLLSRQQLEKAIHVLQLALAKDPEYTKALILMGQAQLQKGMLAEAIENLERAVSKLMLSGYPTEEQSIDHLIVSSLWAGSAYTRQGKPKEGLVHLERIGELKEPEDPKIKAHYFDGLLMLSSALYGAGRREEAAKHLRLLVTYNPAYSEFLEQCEKDDDNELARGVRRDF